MYVSCLGLQKNMPILLVMLKFTYILLLKASGMTNMRKGFFMFFGMLALFLALLLDLKYKGLVYQLFAQEK